VHQHAPVSGGGHGAEGQLGSSWTADGVGSYGVCTYGIDRSSTTLAIPTGLTATASSYRLATGAHCSMLYFTSPGFDLPVEELKMFRQWGSRTPGHPEYGKTPGVEATTGPLGQGLANGVGMAIAEAALAARFNRPGHQIVDHFTYVLVSDGDLEEGISSESGSIAGHQHLGKLIVLYADNHITIEGSTELTFTEDRMARFAAFGWHVQRVEQSNDVETIALALENACEVKQTAHR
jgi:transketolase